MVDEIIVSNRSDVAGKTISHELGIVSASMAPSRFILKDIMARIREFFGIEMIEYTEMIESTRNEIIKRMIKKAKILKANAIVNVRFMATGISAGSAEMMVYGTAVRFEK